MDGDASTVGQRARKAVTSRRAFLHAALAGGAYTIGVARGPDVTGPDFDASPCRSLPWKHHNRHPDCVVAKPFRPPTLTNSRRGRHITDHEIVGGTLEASVPPLPVLFAHPLSCDTLVDNDNFGVRCPREETNSDLFDLRRPRLEPPCVDESVGVRLRGTRPRSKPPDHQEVRSRFGSDHPDGHRPRRAWYRPR